MRLTSIQFCNFRQFYGQTPKLELAHQDSKKVTVIHGNNGSGKTTVLNGFTWVLYEKFTAAFASPDQLVNKRAIAEASPNQPITCWVEITFEHGNIHYRMRRTRNATKTETETETGTIEGNSEVTLQFAEPDGRWRSPNPNQSPEDIVGRILPVSLHPYFFFDGERIEQIVRSNQKAEIAEATKVLLGLEVAVRAITHLGAARKTLEKELAAIGNPETQQLLDKKAALEQEIEQRTQDQTRIAEELQSHQTLKQTLSSQLRALAAAKEMQLRRDDLENQEQAEKLILEKSHLKLKELVSTKGYTVFLHESTTRFREIVDDLRQRGELPADIKKTFIQDLLTRQRCICGAELLEGTPAHQHVQAYLDRAGLADVEEAVIRMSAHMNTLDQNATSFRQEVDQQQQAIQAARTALSSIETALDDIRDQLRNSPSEDIRKLEQRLEAEEESIRRLTLQEGENQGKIADRQSEIDKLTQQVKKLQLSEAKQAKVQRQIAATEDAINRLKQIQLNIDQVFRADLEKQVQKIFNQITTVPYSPRLTENYELTLIETTTGQERSVAASTGENQVLSLSFIAAIIERVRQWSKKSAKADNPGASEQAELLMGPDSGTFPIVMDSPFGSLDELYRRQVAKALPKLVNQLLVLVSKTQWRGEVEEEMAPYIGKEYVLVYNSPKPEAQRDEIRLHGEAYPLVRLSPNEFEYTDILEVTL